VKSLGPVVDVAIPHEAGHILVGRAVGLHARGLDVEVVRCGPDVIRIGNFATLALEPPDEEIPGMEPDLNAAFMLFIGGGVAGNKFCGATAVDPGADADRESLARVTKMSLEEVSDHALKLIKSHKRPFRQLVSLIRQRYRDLIRNRNIQTGRHTLVTKEDLDELFSEYVSAESEANMEDSV
jgi:hypothetical protein